MNLTHLVAFRFLRGASEAVTPTPGCVSITDRALNSITTFDRVVNRVSVSDIALNEVTITDKAC